MDNKFLQAFRELGLHLGTKLDTIKSELTDGFRKLSHEVQDTKQRVQLDISTVEVDLTSRAIKELQASSDLTINKIGGVLQDIAKKEQADLTSLVATITKLKDALTDRESDDKLEQQMLETLKAIEATQQELLDSEESEEICTEIRGAVKQIVTAIKAIELEESETDLKPVTSALKDVEKSLTEIKQTIRATDNSSLLKDILAAVKASKTEAPKTLKLDDSQFRALRTAGGGGGGGGSASPSLASNRTLANLSMPTANTEYSYTFPANTMSWTVKLRSQNTLMLYSFTTGKLPTSGDGLAYATTPQNFLQSQSGVDWSGKTIYLQTGSATQVAEIISYAL